jgi:hypothetical protein
MLTGGTKWRKEVGWSEAVHPWMSGYCGFFALALNRQFPKTSIAIECLGDHFAHALVHVENNFFDARGPLKDYQEITDRIILTDLDADDLRFSGLLSPKKGVRELPEQEVLGIADNWISANNFQILTDPFALYQCAY